MLQTLLCQYEEELTAFYSVSFSACALSPSLPLSFPSCCPPVLLPHQPLHTSSPTDGISISIWFWWKNMFEKYMGLVLMEGRRAMHGLSLLSWCPLCPKLHWSVQWTGGRAQSPGPLVPHPPWCNSCCTTSCLQLGDTCPLVISSGYFPQQQGQVHFVFFPILLWKCKLWEERDIVLLFHLVMQIPLPHREWMNKYPWYKC